MKQFRRIAAVVALPLLLAGGASLAAPAPDAAPEAGADLSVDMGAVRSAQSRLESGLASLGSMAAAAKSDGDASMASCLEDKVARAQDIMNTADAEMLVLKDQSASAQSKAFAAEKLQAAADAMDGVMSAAKGCSGEQELEENDNVTRNELDKTDTIPVEDPTISPTEPPLPPPVDQGQPPTAASPTI
ncbi:MAG: hypothetical protein AAGA54_28795 [Myxococcota bacterium]